MSIGDAVTMREGGDASLGRIDQYELVRELGGGGFGCVYLAHDTVAGIDVAVKGLPPLVRQNKEELENIRRNFALVSRLHHPHVAAALVLHPAKAVTYADRATAEKLRVFEGDFLVVMEYAPGVTLSQWRRQFPNGKVPVTQVKEIVRQVADALDYAHAEKIIHRDIKPANVMIETREKAKGEGGREGNGGECEIVVRVLDFGLAAEVRSSMGRVSQQVTDKSGTRPYMAPEQWLGKRQNAATDQYALAVMTYELLTGDVPFASVFETGDPVVMMNVVGREAPELSGDLPRGLRQAFATALAKEPQQRFASCCAFAEALSSGRRAQASFAPLGWSLAVLALVAALGVGGYSWWRQRAEAERRAEEARLAEVERQVQLEQQNRADERRKLEEIRLADKAASEKLVADKEAVAKAAKEAADKLAAERAAEAVAKKAAEEAARVKAEQHLAEIRKRCEGLRIEVSETERKVISDFVVENVRKKAYHNVLLDDYRKADWSNPDVLLGLGIVLRYNQKGWTADSEVALWFLRKAQDLGCVQADGHIRTVEAELRIKPYLEAFRSGSLDRVKALVTPENPGKDVIDSSGRNLFEMAAGGCGSDVLEYLFGLGYDPLGENPKTGHTPVFSACGNTNGVMAVANLDWLVRHGADVKAPNYKASAYDNATPVFSVRTVQAFNFMVGHGADIRSLGGQGNSLLHVFARNGLDRELVERVVAMMPENVNALNDQGMTPLHLAADCWSDESARIVTLLLDSGAKVDARVGKGPQKGMQATHLAAVTCNLFPKRAGDVIKALCARGADANARVEGSDTYEGMTPLMFAVREGNGDAITDLAGYCGARVNETMTGSSYLAGCQAIHFAADNVDRCETSVKTLLLRGADINAPIVGSRYYEGQTLLHRLANASDNLYGERAIRFVVSRQAHVNARDARGRTPLDVAQASGHSNLVRVLRELGGQEGGKPAAKPPAETSETTFRRAVAAESSHDDATAVRLYRKAAEARHPEALHRYGLMLFFGHGVERNVEQAMAKNVESAKLGCVKAQKFLGIQWHVGTVVPRNEEKSVFWFRKAAEGGDAYAKKWLSERGK